MNMKKWIIAAVACSALALGACGGQNKNSSAANPDKVYRVGMNAEFAPFESQTSEGNVEGFDVDLMNAMAKAGNFKVEFKHQPWESLHPCVSCPLMQMDCRARRKTQAIARLWSSFATPSCNQDA